MNNGVRKTLYLSKDIDEAVTKYLSQKHINFSEAVRELLDKALCIEYMKDSDDVIRSNIRSELEICLKVFLEPYLERLIALTAKGTRTSAAALMTTVGVLSETYIDRATPEEILALSLKQASAYIRQKERSYTEYKQEAAEMLSCSNFNYSSGGV